MPQHRHSLFSLLLIAASAGTALGQVDSVTMVLDPAAGIGSKSLATFGYNPVNDSIYVTTYGAGSDAPGNGAVVRFDNIASGSPTFTTLMSEAQLQLYYRDGDPDRSVSTPSQSGFLLNPLPVGDRPAYSFAMITDLALTRLPGSNTVDPTATKRVYSYSLEPVAPTGDGRDVFTTRVTLADMKAIAGASSTSSNTGRQFAWSGDGQSIYFVDSSTAYDGLWTVGAVAGSLQRLVADNMDTAEPAVMTAGGIDTIYFGGGGVTGNDGGIDMVTYDGTTVSGRQVAVPAALLREFHETTADANVVAIATDAAGNLYYTNTTSSSSSAGTPTQRGIFRYDTEGRISKVLGFSERIAAFGDRDPTPNANSFRLQPRTVTYSGSEGDFEVLQLLYAEPSSVNAVAGAYAFKPGDFNRDNTVDTDDVALFVPQVTLRGVVKTDAADLKYDFNANDVVDWKDVQIFQQFLEYGSPTVPDPTLRIFADADFNGVVDFADFRTMRDAMGQSGQTFLAGDFDGNDRVDFADAQLLDRGYGAVSALIGSGVTPTPFEQAEWDAFWETVQIDLDVADGVTTTQFDLSYPRIMKACAVTKTGPGELLFTGANAYAGPTTVAAGTLRLFNAEAAVNSAVTVADGATLSVGPAVRAEVASLELAPTGLVDLTSGRLIVGEGVDAGELRSALQAGRNGGNWDGTAGITSSAVGASGTRAVGYVLGADGAAVVAFAAPGDVDLNGEINAFDLVKINASATFGNGQPAIWSQGDFNYDGFTNALDLVSINASGVFGQGSYLPLASAPVAPSGLVSAVPEPGSVGLLVGAAAVAGQLVRRRARATRSSTPS
jgi:autotransporter-associated beta strand protein